MVRKGQNRPSDTASGEAGPATIYHGRKTATAMFTARCESQPAVASSNSESLSLVVSQRVRTMGIERAWDTIVIQCSEDADRTLNIRVIVSNPDWEERVQIAHLKSRPRDASSFTALGCNLDHRRIAL